MRHFSKNTFIIAGGAASALLAVAIAAASESDHVAFIGGPFGGPISIEDVRTRELKRLMRMDENEDGKVTFDEFRARRDFTASLPNFDEMEVEKVEKVEEIVEWSESLAGDGFGQIVIKRTGDDPVDVRAFRHGLHGWLGRGEMFMEKGSDWFDLADADGNGALDRAEVDSAPERVRDHRFQRRFDRLDLNKDEVLDEADVDLRVNKLTALDDDSDGELSPSELSEVMRLLGPSAPFHDTAARAIRKHRKYDRRSH